MLAMPESAIAVERDQRLERSIHCEGIAIF